MYITSTEYVAYTGRDASEATETLIARSCMLLDGRIGIYKRQSDGYKLDLSELPDYQVVAVKDWVAHMVAHMADTGGSTPTGANVTLGRFSVSQESNSGKVLIPDSMGYIDSALVASGLIQRAVKEATGWENVNDDI